MSNYSDTFKTLAKSLAGADLEFPNLKAIVLAQWMLESGRGHSMLALKHMNFGGLKWRDEMKGFATPVDYTDSANEGDSYCAFDGVDSFIKGYWHFLERSPYLGWKVHSSDPAAFIAFIGRTYCPSNEDYTEHVLALLPEAVAMLQQSGATSVYSSVSAVPKYMVKFYSGNYSVRQKSANADKCICYAEHHFNSADPSANYALAVVAANASLTSINWGMWYAQAAASLLGTKVFSPSSTWPGVALGGIDGRGNENLLYTDMPAILLEPLFVSNPKQAAQLKQATWQDALAKTLADSIRKFFPDGGLVAFSIGHKGKTSNPTDCGAAIHGGGHECEYAEIVLKKAATLLEK
ncbi:glucosaminidase domain-containing protein [Megalodesulfovibrio gigas]|uniref:Putative N-acetylmuramoyl-L-alanine amidase n=1 Tax=Megalodesulfovibrio gigas (strain ATCC 19364 / DSM 1382 / NCIMB 9332 / VKM B-1759) TaxID=1121448 RepID=T2GGC8_MEGG1|nr:glucosaminidase domain-containing protein [Megalodesulfovibrio gigas]AGW15052.1 putative N-acetylmuramoyl-L-alanine amidase [Megalodesulfovibrio gigas DSM 1382 = ATCC 19364]